MNIIRGKCDVMMMNIVKRLGIQMDWTKTLEGCLRLVATFLQKIFFFWQLKNNKKTDIVHILIKYRVKV
jgi:hypothetical protein